MTRRKTHEEFLKDVYDSVGNEYEVLGKYKLSNIRILMKHNKCSHEWEVFPAQFLRGTRCPKCSPSIVGNKKRLNQGKRFVQKVKEVHGDEYLVLSEYKGSHEYVEVKHVTCGRIYEVQATGILSGAGCLQCFNETRGKHRTLSQQEYKDRVMKKHGDEYEPIGKYVNDITPILVRHKTCGHEWKVKPYNFMRRGTGCPQCKESKGERRISVFFDYSFYKYERQYKIDECRQKLALPFDFAIFHENKLICLIEYQGIQHYKPVDLFGGEENLKDIQKRDKIKRDYCKANNIPLIEIPYSEKEIESKLKIELDEIHRMNNIKDEQLNLFN